MSLTKFWKPEWDTSRFSSLLLSEEHQLYKEVESKSLGHCIVICSQVQDSKTHFLDCMCGFTVMKNRYSSHYIWVADYCALLALKHPAIRVVLSHWKQIESFVFLTEPRELFCHEVTMQRLLTLQTYVYLYILGEERPFIHRGFFSWGYSSIIYLFHVLYLWFSADNTCALILLVTVKLSLRTSQERESGENQLALWS